MFIELVDALRCLTPHEETWLVAAVTRMEGRHIVEGVLGCPVCRREYPIRNRTGWFTDGEPGSTTAPLRSPGADTPDRALRLAALLGIVDPGGIVVLGADWTDCADAIAELGVAHVVVLTATDTATNAESVSALVVDDRLPFATGSLRGIAFGPRDGRRVPGVPELLRARGRLVAATDTAVPASLTELARDAHDWVAERGTVASAPVPLRSVRR